MKTLYIVRHGDAQNAGYGIDDIDRPLSPKGESESQEIADIIKNDTSSPDLIISSPANRALRTAEIFADTFNYSRGKIKIEDLIYEAEFIKLIELVKNLSDDFKSVMLFGHNPIFSHLGVYFCSSFNKSMPKSGVLALEFEIDSWSEIKESGGTLKFFKHP